MSPTMKMILALCGTFLTSFSTYYGLHSGPGVLLTTPNFWIGAIITGGLMPLGSLMVGLSLKAPWEGNAPPPGGKP